MWLFGLNAGKTHLVSFNLSNNNDTNDLKMDGSVFQENSFFKMLGLTFPSKLDSALILSLLLKLPPRTLKPSFILWSFLLLRLLFISRNLTYNHVWNIVLMSRLVLLITTWNCWISYKNGYIDCWSFTCCLSWTLG